MLHEKETGNYPKGLQAPLGLIKVRDFHIWCVNIENLAKYETKSGALHCSYVRKLVSYQAGAANVVKNGD